MSSCPPCLPPKGQLFHFPPTDGPLLLLGEALRCGSAPLCAPVCIGPQLPKGTIVFFAPAKRAPPYRPPLPPAPPPPVVPSIYVNSEQTCINECPEGTTGDPISVTVSAGTHFSEESQAAADALAMAAACAEAATQREATPCVGNEEVEATMVSESRNCELCGFSEFTDLSTPPKKYRTKTASGSLLLTEEPPCSASTGTSQQDFFGSCQYNAETCALTSGMTFISYLNGTEVASGSIACNATFGTLVCVVTASTKTVNSFTGTNVCCQFATDDFGFPLYHVASGAQLFTLSDEDTDADAIARATPAVGSPNNVAKYESRTAFTFAYQTVSIDLNATGLIAGQDYRITLPVTIEDYGGGNPIEAPLVYDFTATGATELISDIITAAIGKQNTMGTPTIALL